jgi:hypothetical protein
MRKDKSCYNCDDKVDKKIKRDINFSLFNCNKRTFKDWFDPI